jgi:sulfite reductase (NADPH) flavoprotein alpha-component
MSSMRNPAAVDRATLGNGVALMLLALVAVALARWNAGDWWMASPHATRWIAAGFAVLAYAGACGWIFRRAALRDGVAATSLIGEDTLWVVHASQTGFATELATLSLTSLEHAGASVRLADLGRLTADHLVKARRVLFVVSTTGEGDPPDPAITFVNRVMTQSLPLASLQYAVLALGDRQYDQFCAFGHRLDDWLRRQGARPLFDLVEVDNADQSALRHWQHHLGQLCGSPDLPDWSAPLYETWTLVERVESNPGSVGGPAFRIALAPPAGTPMAWLPGDIAEIGPCHAATTVAAFLGDAGLPADATVVHDGITQRLGDVLARSRLPSPESVRGESAQRIAEGLVALPHREYSIASLPAEGGLHLLVRLMKRSDGTCGLGSGWLGVHAPVGGSVALRVRSNPNFHPPLASTPLILVGNGTGIAGLRAHLKARIEAGARRNWLLFGERQSARDLHYRQELEHWEAAGFLSRVDLAFSRDGAERRYVQHLLTAQAALLREWVREGAAIYVCGSLAGMAPGVDAALREALGDATVEALLAEGRYRRDVY